MATKASNVIEALTAVMAELPAIGKDSQAAPQQGGYRYRGIEAITQHVQPLFAKHGIVMVPQVTAREVREIVVNGKPWTDTTLHVTYTVYGPGGADDRIELAVCGVGRDNSDKGANKAMTQALKYALVQMLCISDSKDDADHGSPEADPAPAPDPAALLRGRVSQAVSDGKVSATDVEQATNELGLTREAYRTAPADVMQTLVDRLGLDVEPAK